MTSGLTLVACVYQIHIFCDGPAANEKIETFHCVKTYVLHKLNIVYSMNNQKITFHTSIRNYAIKTPLP